MSNVQVEPIVVNIDKLDLVLVEKDNSEDLSSTSRQIHSSGSGLIWLNEHSHLLISVFSVILFWFAVLYRHHQLKTADMDMLIRFISLTLMFNVNTFQTFTL